MTRTGRRGNHGGVMEAQVFIAFVTKHGPAIIQKGYDGYCSLGMDALCDELATTLALRDAGRALVQLADITWALSKVLATHPSAKPNAWQVLITVCTACGVPAEFAYQCMTVLYQHRLAAETPDPVEEQLALLEAVLPPNPDDSVLGQLLQPVDRPTSDHRRFASLKIAALSHDDDRPDINWDFGSWIVLYIKQRFESWNLDVDEQIP